MQKLITILGPTATGKTKIAVHLAAKIGGEIISADSRQVYRRMDIGTGKDLDEYKLGINEIPYHSIDIAEPGSTYDVFQFTEDFRVVWNDITRRNRIPILCGGSGMYIDAVVRDYDMPKVPVNESLRNKLSDYSDQALIDLLKSYRPLHNTTDTTDRKRTLRAIEIAEFSSKHNPSKKALHNAEQHVFGIFFARDKIRYRITERLKSRLEKGLVEEVSSLLNDGLTSAQLKYYGLEYKFVTMYILGELTYDEMFSKLNTAIHQFAKRQMTWFRRMEKKGLVIHWLDGQLETGEKLKTIMNYLD